MRDLADIRAFKDLKTLQIGLDGGAFEYRYRGARLRIIASTGGGWDHVSVEGPGRVPRYREMVAVKRVFFLPQEVAMELHVPGDSHVNLHPYTLHLWRPQDVEIPLPPIWMV